MRLFCYGTLLFPDIMLAVIHRLPRSYPATLHDYACCRLHGHNYPAIVSETGVCTRGRVYTGLRPADLGRLDAYEGDLYQRVRLRLTGLRGRRQCTWVYMLKPARRHRLSSKIWIPAAGHPTTVRD